MNNHPNGDAVANAFELIHLLEEKLKIQMPNNIKMLISAAAKDCIELNMQA